MGLAEPEIEFGGDKVQVRISRVFQHLQLCSDPLPTGAIRQIAKITGRRLPDGATYGEGAVALGPSVAMRAVRMRLLPVGTTAAA